MHTKIPKSARGSFEGDQVSQPKISRSA